MKLEYICRQDLLEEIDEIIGYINFTSPYQDDNDLIVRGLERARDAIECAYTADVRENAKYCPNCGAKMEKSNEKNKQR